MIPTRYVTWWDARTVAELQSRRISLYISTKIWELSVPARYPPKSCLKRQEERNKRKLKKERKGIAV